MAAYKTNNSISLKASPTGVEQGNERHRFATCLSGTVSSGLICAMAALTLLLSDATAQAQWTQWGGPQRNFVADSKGLADKWPEEGPKKLWSRELGDGYGTILVDDGTLYTMYRVEQDEFTVALDAATGKTRWEHKHPSPTTPLMEEFGAGPHATPLVVGDKLISIGTNMALHAFDRKTGKVAWKHDLVTDFGATVPGRGYSCSPILYQNTVIVPVGGEDKEGQSLMAFEPDTGSVLWKNQSFDISHSSPILIRFDGEDQLVFFSTNDIAGYNPGNGERLWSHLHPTQYGANLSTPTFNGKDMLFASAAYDSGARVIRLSRKEGKTVPEELWYSRKMRLHHGNAIVIGDYVYGSSGDFGPAFFVAAHLPTGELAWRERGFRKATMVMGDGKLIVLDEDGKLALVTVTPEKMTVHSECTIAERYAWAAPTLVGKHLYVRDRKHIMAFDLG